MMFNMFLLVLVAVAVTGLSLPPVVLFPKRWKAEFKETAYMPRIFRPDKVVMNSTGAWYYDWDSKQSIHFHKNGSSNPFCGLNDKTHQPCWLRFAANDAAYAQYEDGTCCEFCAPGKFCSILKPDWLTVGGNVPMYLGEAEIDGEVCYGYGRPGRVTKYDGWYVLKSDQKTPCAYHEVMKLPAPPGFSHNITFDRATYNEDFDQSIFDMPAKCQAKCPRQWPPYQEKIGTRVLKR